MTMAKITADVYSSEDGAVYRVYINDHLMTERTFRWSITENFVKEQLVIDGPPGEYSIYVTPVSACTLKNVTVNGKPSGDTFTLH